MSFILIDSVDDVSDLEAKLPSVSTNASISKFCKTDDHGKVTFFDTFEEQVEEMIHLFHILVQKAEHNLFLELWVKKKQHYIRECEQSQRKPSLSLQQVVQNIWNPVYTECNQILQDLATLAMPVKKLNEYIFSNKSKENLELMLKYLFQSLHDCIKFQGREVVMGEEWIRDAVDRILQYRILCKYANAAKILRKVQSTWKLTGDFTVVEALSEQVNSKIQKCTL